MMDGTEWFYELFENLEERKEVQPENYLDENGQVISINGKFSNGYLNKIVGLSKKYIVLKVLEEFLRSIIYLNIQFRQLGINFDSRKIRVWIELDDTDAKQKNDLLKVEGITNLKFQEHGISLLTTVVFVADNIRVPDSYLVIL